MKRFMPVISFAIGVLGTFTSIYTMGDNLIRTISVMVFLLLGLVGLFGLLSQEIDWLSAWSILRESKRLGIRGISETGISNSNRPQNQMARAKTIRIMAISANTLIKQRKAEIVGALREQRANVRVLLAQPGSQFVSDIEKGESSHRLGQISAEIKGVEGLLQEYVEEAASGRKMEEIGSVRLGYYATQFRSSLTLCDEDWGWLTLNLCPKRAVQSASLELSRADDGLLRDCIVHFDRCWEIVEQCGQSFQILPKRDSEGYKE